MTLCMTTLVLLTGCASNPFADHYTPIQPIAQIKDKPKLKPEDITIRRLSPKATFDDILEDGYILVGVSEFLSSIQSEKGMVQQARLIGAPFVAYYTEFMDKKQGYVPIQSFRRHQVYRQVRDQAGVIRPFPHTYTTASTDYIPYRIERYNYTTGFFKKGPAPNRGLYVADLTGQQRRTLKRNTGVVVHAVVKRSPAFNRQVLRDDVIIKINNNSIADGDDFDELMSTISQETPLNLILLRDQKQLKIQLPGRSSQPVKPAKPLRVKK